MKKILLLCLVLAPLFSFAQKAIEGPDFIFANIHPDNLDEKKMKDAIATCLKKYSPAMTFQAAGEKRNQQIDHYYIELEEAIKLKAINDAFKKSQVNWNNYIKSNQDFYYKVIETEGGGGSATQDMLAEKYYNEATQRALFLKEMYDMYK